jgi:DNA (cytosine-5)-methyltransferase 1
MPGLDWRWCAEIDPFAGAVHAARFPGVPNLGDVNQIEPDAVEPVELVVFGSPCQSFSVAGRRLGLDDPRGNLALVALRLVGKLRPRWLVFENVPGLLSSDEGRDFGAFLGLLGECGYGFAYRVLDAQHFGVPQRRRRVFVVGHFGNWRPAAAVLFEPESLRGDSAPRREKGKELPPALSAALKAAARIHSSEATAATT